MSKKSQYISTNRSKHYLKCHLILIRYIPRLSISQLVRRLKQESTRQLWLHHHSTLRQYYWYIFSRPKIMLFDDICCFEFPIFKDIYLKGKNQIF